MTMARRTEISSSKPKKHMPIYIPESTWLDNYCWVCPPPPVIQSEPSFQFDLEER